MKVSVAHSSSTVEAAAAHWAAACDANPDHTPPGLEAWLGEHPRHAGALLRAQAMLALLAAPVEVAVDRMPAPRIWRPMRWVAGALAMAAGVAGLLLYDAHAPTYATGLGDMRQVTLAEGSSLSLDTQTSLRVDIDRDSRVVRLDEGRTLLRVRHDAARPFRVQAGAVTITDIGTVFQVIRRGDAVTVLVSEGLVEARGPTGVLRLSAGQMASFGGAGTPAPQSVSAAAMDRATAWTSGRIDLDGERLDAAIDEMNRHNRLKITLANPALGGEKLYGAFRLDDPAGFARTAALSVGATAHDADGAIIIAGQ